MATTPWRSPTSPTNTFAAAGLDLTKPHTIPDELWVWNEGAPRDVPLLEGRKTLLVGPPVVGRTWNAGRPFSALRAEVEVLRELSATELRAALERASAAADAAASAPNAEAFASIGLPNGQSPLTRRS